MRYTYAHMIEHLLNDFSGVTLVSIKLLAYIRSYYLHFTCTYSRTYMNINEAENLDDYCKAVRTNDTDSLINEVHD